MSVTLPLLNTPLSKMAADRASLDAVFVYEVSRSPFTALVEAAHTTERIGLATGIGGAFPRTPFVMVNAAADIDDLSGGQPRPT